MKSVRTTTENNLIKIHFGLQETEQLNAIQDESDEQKNTAMVCEGGVCALNWSPVRPAVKKEQAA